MNEQTAQTNFTGDTARRGFLPDNLHGRDFLVGDLHGCYEPLYQALNAVHFDPQQDRLISVGDLVDRGPDSIRCLGLLEESWFHAVLGNHEAAMLAHAGEDLAGGTPEAAQWHLAVGGAWLDDCWPWEEHPRLLALLRLAGNLPHVLHIGEGANRYHVVHAQLPVNALGRTWTDQRLESDWSDLDPAVLVWSRRLFTTSPPFQREWHRGLSPVFCGHIAGDGVRVRLSHVCLDTGVVYGWRGDWESAAITLAEPREGEIACHRFLVQRGTFLGPAESNPTILR